MADTSIGRLREDICHYLEDDLASGQRFSKKNKKSVPDFGKAVDNLLYLKYKRLEQENPWLTPRMLMPQ